MTLKLKIPKRETYLSDVSWGVAEPELKKKRHKSIPGRRTRFSMCLVPPLKEEYKGHTANFVFGGDDPKTKDWTEQKFISLIPFEYNPSLWVHRYSGCLALRVPRRRKKTAIYYLKKNGFWYWGSKNKWYKWRRKKWKHQRNRN